MSSNNLIIEVTKKAKRALLIAALASSAVAFGTANILGVEDTFGTIVLVSTLLALFLMTVWINASFERLKFEGDTVSYRYFLFVQRSVKRSDIEEITIGEHSGRLRVYAKGKKFASLNFAVIDIGEEELKAFAKQQGIPVYAEESK
jgi:hypothetical protein